MKRTLLLFAGVLFTTISLAQDKYLFAEGTISIAWNTTDVKSKSTLGLGYGLGFSFNYDYGRRFGYDVKFRYHEACWHGHDFDRTDLGYLGANYDGPLSDYKEQLGFTINNFSNDAKEYGLEFAVHLNRLREEKNIDPYVFGGISLVKNQAKGDLIHYIGLPKIYNYDDFDLTKENVKDVLDGTYETALEGSQYGKRIQLMPGIGVGLVYHLTEVIALGVEHKTVFTLRDDFDGFIPGADRGVKNNKDLFHYTGAVLRLNCGLESSKYRR